MSTSSRGSAKSAAKSAKSAGKSATKPAGKAGAKAAKPAKARKPAKSPVRAPRIQARRSAIHGRGVFALEAIREGTTIIEYTGERITEAEIDRRYPESREQMNHTFVFGIRHDVNIDGGVGGNASRFINHACDANCDTFEKDDRMFIRAARNIRAGEELTYDYAIEAGEPITPQLKACWPCWCGARTCRGTVLVRTVKRSRRKSA
jgi:SET domain-containing protein